MILYILALFSLFLVIPIVYLLPLNFSIRGKMFIIGLSLFTSICGIAAENILVGWQSILLMLLCVILITYILMKKSSDLLFISNQEEDMEDSLMEDLVFEKEKSYSEKKVNVLDKEENVLLDSSFIEKENVLEEIEEKEIAVNETIKLESIEEDLAEKSITDEASEEENLQIIGEAKRDAALEEKETEVEELPALNYMEEIESLIVQGDAWRTVAVSQDQEGKDETADREMEQEPFEIDNSLLEEIDLIDFMENSQTMKQEESISLSMEEIVEEIHLLNEEQLAADQLEAIEMDIITVEKDWEVLELDTEEAYIEELEMNDAEASPTEWIKIQTENESEEKAVDAFEKDANHDIVQMEEKPDSNVLSKKVIDNTFLQLNVLKNIVSKEEYESAVLNCLNETMSLQEYFAFAHLLIEQYVHYKEKEKLNALFQMLKDKFSSEAIMLEQLLFMEKTYLPN
ncbi:hypothetical protein [Niallia sp. 03133]|uniref:hypothetical protein n=1 Tax=Niallia sp. 03133 TaxID=3458060 RepID=UPI0040439FDF